MPLQQENNAVKSKQQMEMSVHKCLFLTKEKPSPDECKLQSAARLWKN
jgi:hypothetical protein